MYNQKVKRQISDLIRNMLPELEQMIDNAPTSEMATRNVMNYVSSKVTGASRGYLSSIYSAMSKETLKENIFQNPANANKFYALDLDKKLVNVYRLDVKNLDSYKKGISVKEINRIYASAGAAVGGAGIGKILLGAISGVIDIPLVVIIGGAVACGLGAGVATYLRVVPKITKAQYKKEIGIFMKEFEKEMHSWVDAVESYYKSEVDALRKTL